MITPKRFGEIEKIFNTQDIEKQLNFIRNNRAEYKSYSLANTRRLNKKLREAGYPRGLKQWREEHK